MGQIELYAADWGDVDTANNPLGIFRTINEETFMIINTQIIEQPVRDFINSRRFDRVKIYEITHLSNICIRADNVFIKRCSSTGTCAVVADRCGMKFCNGAEFYVIANYVEVYATKSKIIGLVGVIRHHGWDWDTIRMYCDNVPTAHVFIVGGVISSATRAFGNELGIVFAHMHYKDKITAEFIDKCTALVALHDML